MKTRISIITLLSVIAISVWAQNNAPANSKVNDEVIWSTQQRMYSGSQYVGPVYEPFGNTVPSDQSEVGQATSARSGSNTHRSLINGPEDPAGPSPVGDAVLPLLAMALLFGAVVYRKRLRREA